MQPVPALPFTKRTSRGGPTPASTFPGKHGSGPITVTWNEQLDELSEASVAVQFTVVAPSGNALPDGGLQIRLGEGSQASLPVTLNVTMPSFVAQSVVTSTGHWIADAVVSRTVTVNAHELEFGGAA